MSSGLARLWTGMGCVGSLVVLASILLITGAPDKLFPNEPLNAGSEVLAIVCFLTTVVLVMLPFDVIGGLLIPAAVDEQEVDVRLWIKGWTRSIVLQVGFFAVTSFAYLQISRAFGAPWLIAFFAVLQVGLLAGQELVWRLMTSPHSSAAVSAEAAVVAHRDPRFTGGITGLPGRETIMIPLRWRSELDSVSYSLLIRRRKAALQTGARSKGVITAMVWNMLCFTGAILLAGTEVAAVSDLVSVFLWFLLLSFAGLLMLPFISRRSVLALDQYMARETDHEAVASAIQAVDRITECDSDRSVVAESIFQPIPCPRRRVLALTQPADRGAFGGPLARAVHCNVGRPELWAILPAD